VNPLVKGNLETRGFEEIMALPLTVLGSILILAAIPEKNI
jgi:hypothetical protein